MFVEDGIFGGANLLGEDGLFGGDLFGDADESTDE